MSLALHTPAVAEPITLDEAKAHARIAIEDDDAHVGILIKAARKHCEGRCNRSLAVQTWDLTLDGFPGFAAWFRTGPFGRSQGICRDRSIELPRPPLVSVESIEYLDADGVLQTLAPEAYRVSAGTPGRVEPAPGLAWPAAGPYADAVRIRYVAGWSAEELPEDGKLALLQLVAHWYDARLPISSGAVSDVPFTVDALLGGIDWRVC